MPANYIPNRDADFATWLANFNAVAVADGVADYGLSAGEVTAITGVNTSFQSAYTTSQDPSTRTPASIAAKDTARASAVQLVRPLATRIAASPAIVDSLKVAIGVTVRKTVPTPVPAPVSSPSLMLESATPGLANLQYRDSLTPTAKAKPFGVIGLEVWSSIGTVPAVDPSACIYRGTFTKTPFQLPTGPTPGKIVTVFARWINRSGVGGVAAVGPWSTPLVTASV